MFTTQAAAPLMRCTGVVVDAATTACRGPAGIGCRYADVLDSSPLKRTLQDKVINIALQLYAFDAIEIETFAIGFQSQTSKNLT
jgi:hypothetical protein